MSISVEKTKSQILDLICKIRPYIKEAKRNQNKILSYISNGYDKDILSSVKLFFEEDDYIFSFKELQPKTFEVLIKWK